MSMLEIIDLHKIYEDSDSEKAIIEHVSFSVEENEFVCILGPSGCGKTTLLRCIAGFEKYDGTIKVDGNVVTEPNTDRMLVFQDFNQLFPWKSVLGNVCYPLKKFGIKDKKEREDIARKYLEKVGLANYAHFYPHQLSGGMKQRVAIAKALAVKPKLMLMDEPFASLDAMTRRKLQKELLNLSNEENVTVLFITHNIQEAVVLGTRIMMMSKDGTFKIDIKNPLSKPITPSSEGYAQLWDTFNQALSEESLN